MKDGIQMGIVPDFQETFRKGLATTSRTLPEALNTAMFYIARGASRGTPKTTRQVIEQELGVSGYRTVYNKDKGVFATRQKNGSFRIGTRRSKRGSTRVGVVQGGVNERQTRKRHTRNAVLNTGALAARIINARLGRVGKKGLHGSAMRAAVASLLAKRFRSVGTLKAGWLGAIRTLGRIVGQPAREEGLGAAAIIKGRSTVKPAREGWSPEVSMQYNTNSFAPGHRPYIDARVQSALAAAYNEEAQKINERIISKLQKRLDALPSKPQTGKADAMAMIKRMTR